MPPVAQPPPPPSPSLPSPPRRTRRPWARAFRTAARISPRRIRRRRSRGRTPRGRRCPGQAAKRATRGIQQRSVAALFLALLSLFGVLGLSNFQRGVYIVAFALVAGAMAIWLAATALRRARRGGTAGPRGSVVAIMVGGVGVLVSGVLLAGFALFGKQASTFTRCLSGANTVAAQQTCRTQFTRAIEKAAR